MQTRSHVIFVRFLKNHLGELKEQGDLIKNMKTSILLDLCSTWTTSTPQNSKSQNDPRPTPKFTRKTKTSSTKKREQKDRPKQIHIKAQQSHKENHPAPGIPSDMPPTREPQTRQQSQSQEFLVSSHYLPKAKQRSHPASSRPVAEQ
jgi:hypothetical protein